MRIRRRSQKIPDWSSIAQSEAPPHRFMLAPPLPPPSPPPPPPEFMLVPPPPVPTPTSSVAPTNSNIPTDTPNVVCMMSYQWSHHPDALDPEVEELNGASIGSPMRKPRGEPGLAGTVKATSMEMKAEDKIEKKVMKIKAVSKKMKQSRNDYKKKNNKKGRVVQKDVPSDGKVVNNFRVHQKTVDGKWRCKKYDGKKWQCCEPTTEPNTLCDHHLRRSLSFEPKEATAGVKAESASAKALPTLKSAPMKASTNSMLALVKTSVRSKAGQASATCNSNAALSATTLPNFRKPHKKNKVDNNWSGELYYYYSGFGRSSRGKQRGNYNNNNVVKVAANVEEKKSTREDTIAEAREEDFAVTEAQGQDYKSLDEALDNNNNDEITGDEEESDADYYAPLVGNNKSHAKNGQKKVSVSKCPKRFKSLMSL